MIKKIRIKLLLLQYGVQKYFNRPIIVYSTTHDPALLVEAWSTGSGDKYARVKFANKATKQGFIGITDIPAANVIKAVKGSSQFLRDCTKAKNYIKLLLGISNLKKAQ
jgi:hypothetical protein